MDKKLIIPALLFTACASFNDGCRPITTYKFVGTPGTVIKYSGNQYTIPESGSLELLAKRKIDPAMASQPDAYGCVTVEVK